MKLDLSLLSSLAICFKSLTIIANRPIWTSLLLCSTVFIQFWINIYSLRSVGTVTVHCTVQCPGHRGGLNTLSSIWVANRCCGPKYKSSVSDHVWQMGSISAQLKWFDRFWRYKYIQGGLFTLRRTLYVSCN